MKVRQLDGAARFQHQYPHTGLGKRHRCPAATCTRSHYDRVILFSHSYLRKRLHGVASGSSDLLMLRMSTCWKLKNDSVTPIIERFNRSRARRIERECILSFDKPVGCESRMLRRWVAFRSSHLDHQGSSPCRVGRVKSRFSQGCHCRTPLFLRIRPVPVGRMQNEVNEMCTVCLSCAGSFVGRDQNFSEGLNSLEVFGRKELRLIV